MSYRQAAEIISAAIGKPLRFVDESPDEARARRVGEGLPAASSRVLSRSVPISAQAAKQSRSPAPSRISPAGRRGPSPNSLANMQPPSALD